VLSGDPALTLRVLRMANNAALGLRHPVQSVRHATALVGPGTLGSWIVLMLLAEGADAATPAPDARGDVAASELLVRARMCALLADPLQTGPAGAPAFLAGILSGLTATLGLSADGLLAQVLVSAEVAAAVGTHAGPLGAAVGDVEDYLAHRIDRFGPRLPAVRDAYLDALGWSEATLARATLSAA
jgi:EAL and modified HD-GYP domain-containing signal transduction protein